MTTYLGNSGVLKLATNAVAELTGFQIQESQVIVPDIALGDTAETNKAGGIQRWSGSMTGHYYPGDTAQTALVAGAGLAFEGLPIGSTAGLQKITGNIIIETYDVTVANEVIVGFTATFRGNGAMTRGVNS
jgi:hypothetical protein